MAVFIALLLLPSVANAQTNLDDDFVTVWEIPAGNNEVRTITFPGSGSYTIDWGDGSEPVPAMDTADHTLRQLRRIHHPRWSTMVSAFDGAIKQQQLEIQSIIEYNPLTIISGSVQ